MVDVIARVRDVGLVDEILVIDDGSTDATASRAAGSGAQVISTPGRGKGGALRSAAAAARGDLLVFLDADVTSYTTSFIGRMLAPLLLEPAIHLVKGSYQWRRGRTRPSLTNPSGTLRGAGCGAEPARSGCDRSSRPPTPSKSHHA